METSYVDFFLL